MVTNKIANIANWGEAWVKNHPFYLMFSHWSSTLQNTLRPFSTRLLDGRPSSSDPALPFVWISSILFRERTNDRQIIPPLQSLPAVISNVQLASNKDSSRSQKIYQKVVQRVSNEPDSDLSVETDTKIKKPCVNIWTRCFPPYSSRESESSCTSRKELSRVARGKNSATNNKLAITIFSPLSPELQVFIEKTISSRVQSLV